MAGRNNRLLAQRLLFRFDTEHAYGPFGEVIRATGPMAKANPFRKRVKP